MPFDGKGTVPEAWASSFEVELTACGLATPRCIGRGPRSPPGEKQQEQYFLAMFLCLSPLWLGFSLALLIFISTGFCGGSIGF